MRFCFVQVAFNPSGTALLSCSNDSTILFYDLKLGQLKFTLAGLAPMNDAVFRCVCVRMCGSTFTTLINVHEKFHCLVYLSSVCLFASPPSNTHTHTHARTHAHTCTYTLARLLDSPDGSVIAGVDEEGHLSLWDVASGDLFTKVQKHDCPATHVVFDAQGSTVATADDNGTILIWHLSPMEGAAVGPDKGRCVIS